MLHDFSRTIWDKSLLLICMLWRVFELHFCWVMLRGYHTFRRSVIISLVPGAQHGCLASRVRRARLERGAGPQLLTRRHCQILRQFGHVVALARQLLSTPLFLFSYCHSFLWEAIGYDWPHVHAELWCLSVVDFDGDLALRVLSTIAPARELSVIAQVSSHIQTLCQWCIILGCRQRLLELLGRNARESSVRNYSLVIASDCNLRGVLTW